MYTFKRVCDSTWFLNGTNPVSVSGDIAKQKGERRSKKEEEEKTTILTAKRIARLQLSSFNRVRFSFFVFHCLCLLDYLPYHHVPTLLFKEKGHCLQGAKRDGNFLKKERRRKILLISSRS